MPFIIVFERFRNVLHCRQPVRFLHDIDIVALQSSLPHHCFQVCVPPCFSAQVLPFWRTAVSRVSTPRSLTVICHFHARQILSLLMLSAFHHFILTDWRCVFGQHSTGKAGRPLPKQCSPQHDVLYRFIIEPTGAGCPVEGLAITTVQCERHSQFFTVITAEHKTIRTP